MFCETVYKFQLDSKLSGWWLVKKNCSSFSVALL